MKIDEHSFERIALPHLDAVYRVALALCGQPSQADDLAQATFTKALERFDTFRPGTNCRAWLCQILRNLWIDKLRHQNVVGTVLPIEEMLLTVEPHVDEVIWSDAQDLLENFSDEQVIKALRQLPDDQRLTLFLVDVEQFSQEEVAGITRVAVGTVKSRTSRARSGLKEILMTYAKEMGFARGEK